MRPIAGIILSSISIMATISTGRAETVTLAAPYKAVVSGAVGVASAATELLQMDRTVDRLQQIKKTVTTHILKAKSGETFFLTDLPDEREFLCGARGRHLIAVARANYLTSVASQIGAISKQDTPADLFAAIKLMFATYAIDDGDNTLVSNKQKALREGVAAQCEADIRGFDKAYYGLNIPTLGAPASASDLSLPEAIPSLSGLGPVGVAADTIVGIVTPIVVELSTLIDEGKRRDAVANFLKDPTKRARLADAGQQLAITVSAYTWDKRLAQAGIAVEQLTNLRNKGPIDLAKFEQCKDPTNNRLVRSESGAPSRQFITCWAAVWETLEPSVTALMKSANNYDQLADAGDTDSAKDMYKNIADGFKKIGDGEDLPNLADFWSSASKLVHFAETLRAAFSEENRAKLDKAIDAAVKSH
jgi:hypothetical protein